MSGEPISHSRGASAFCRLRLKCEGPDPGLTPKGRLDPEKPIDCFSGSTLVPQALGNRNFAEITREVVTKAGRTRWRFLS